MSGGAQAGDSGEEPARLIYERERLFTEAIETIVGMLDSQGISQRELAARLERNEALVSRLLNGAENTSLKSLARLGYALGIRFAIVPIPFEDRAGTPAAADPPPPAWLDEQRRRRAGEAPAAMPSELG